MKKAAKTVINASPLLIGILILISLFSTWVPKTGYATLFSGNVIIDPIIGSIIGSILAGNPITSYILGGELLMQGVSLVVVTAFIVAWVTVGLIQMPAESIMLGKRFTIVRNISAFIFSIIVAIITVTVVSLI